MSLIQSHIEVIVFTAENPVTPDFLKEMIFQLHNKTLSDQEITDIIDNLNSQYLKAKTSFSIRKIAGGFQFLTLKEFDPVISHVQSNLSRKKLSTSALETLSIVVYKQPVTKALIESIRGVNSDYAIQKLLEKELVKIVGRSEELGKPLLYAAGDKFLSHFGLNSLSDLPKLKEFKAPEEEIGDSSEEE